MCPHPDGSGQAAQRGALHRETYWVRNGLRYSPARLPGLVTVTSIRPAAEIYCHAGLAKACRDRNPW